MAFGGLVLGLFVIMVIAGVVFIASPHLKSAACTAVDSTYSWEGGSCLNESGGTAVTVTAITQIGVVETVAVTVLGLLTLVAIILIFKIVVKVAKGFGGGMN